MNEGINCENELKVKIISHFEILVKISLIDCSVFFKKHTS